MSSSESRRARRTELALIRAGGALAMGGIIPLPPLHDDVPYFAISSFHEGTEPFITLTRNLDARLCEKLGVDPTSILSTVIGRFAMAVKEGVWFGFAHAADLTFGTLRLTATFFDESLLVPMFGPKMIAWFRQHEHEVRLNEMDDVLDICETGIRNQHIPIPASVKRTLSISVDPGEGKWG